MKNCIVCARPVVWPMVVELIEELLAQADCLGLESLTEAQQCLVSGEVCSTCCLKENETTQVVTAADLLGDALPIKFSSDGLLHGRKVA